MSWQDEYHEAVVMAIVRNGSPVGKDASIYGWTASNYVEIRATIEREGIDFKKSTFDDTDWYEFAGTFASNDNHVRGIGANIVLKDGSTTYQFRYSGSFSELLTAVLEYKPQETT